MVTAQDATHIPVLLDETLGLLDPREGACFLDGTLGLAGHSSAIMEQSGGKAFLCGLDRDPLALEKARLRLAGYGDHCRLFRCDFASFETVLPVFGRQDFDGILLDLGVSSMQLDVAERGFSLRNDGPLDMRMDMGNGTGTQSAADFVNGADFETLRRVISEYGEEPLAERIARAIAAARSSAPITRTGQLADIVRGAYPAKWRREARNHPATRTFQAIRMHVNDEIGQLKRFLAAALAHTAPGGVIAVITFHSLEDRIVKQCFRQWCSDCICPGHVTVCRCGHKAEAELLTRRPIVPLPGESAANPRAASAKLRAVRKITTA